jgi:hypothetical protein|tara:strand:- start:874 stop:1032 length:159 start_codon:yes stop_codon:yes gene_type:complete
MKSSEQKRQAVEILKRWGVLDNLKLVSEIRKAKLRKTRAARRLGAMGPRCDP